MAITYISLTVYSRKQALPAQAMTKCPLRNHEVMPHFVLHLIGLHPIASLPHLHDLLWADQAVVLPNTLLVTRPTNKPTGPQSGCILLHTEDAYPTELVSLPTTAHHPTYCTTDSTSCTALVPDQQPTRPKLSHSQPCATH